MTQSVDVRKILLKRGTTAENDGYTGPVGELTLDTEADTIRVHDGITAGGKNTLVTQADLSSALATLGNIDLSQFANAATQQTQINSLSSNAASQQTQIDSITDGTATFGNLIPSANVTYSLGSPTAQWKDLHVSSNTIYIGGQPLSIVNGSLTVNGNLVVGTANTGGLAFVDNAMYALSGVLVENADLSHGATASVLLPANGATGEGSEILINNSYSDVAIGTGAGGTLTNVWRFDTNGNLSIPPAGKIVQPPFSIGPFAIVDGNSYQGYSELYINKSDVPNLDQLIHEGDTVVDGNDSNNSVTLTRPIVTIGDVWVITYTASWPNGNPQTLSFRSIGGTWTFGTNGNFTAPGDIIVGSNPFNNGGNEQHFIIDASNYWTSIQWKNFTDPQDPSATPFECQAQLLRVFASESTVTSVCNIDNPREELVAVTAVRPNNTTHNGIMISTSDGKIPDAPYNDGQGTRHDWVFGGDAKLTTPQGGHNTTSSIGQGPDSDWVNPNNNTWSIRTYNGGFNGVYTHSDNTPLVWWDVANGPTGNNNQFRGAIIEYHAYTNRGTVVGTIIVADDYNPVEYTHSEMCSGDAQLATYKFWDVTGNRGQVALTTAGESTNLMIMWTSRVFYGAEANC